MIHRESFIIASKPLLLRYDSHTEQTPTSNLSSAAFLAPSLWGVMTLEHIHRRPLNMAS